MLFRTLWHLWFVAPRGPRLGLDAVSRSSFRVWPTDLDILRHMNNGKYLSIMDVARFDLIQRIGVLRVFNSQSWYPVVVGQTISYRKSLNPWRRFAIESRIMGFDEQAVYLEQRFVRPGGGGARVADGSDAGGSSRAHARTPAPPEIYARAIVRARILRRSGGVVPIEELIEHVGADPAAFRVPEEILAWGRATRLPSTREAAPSEW